ncbi:MAG: polysaccharide biosynthesis tyrosine autokinase, partial [Bacteroidetes bacterium]
MENKLVKGLNQEQQIDVLDIVRKLVRHWRYYAISVPLCVLWGLYNIKSANDTYEASASVLVNENPGWNNLGESQYMKGGVKLLNSIANIPNEIGLLTSYEMAEKAVRLLDFDVSYFKKETFRSVEIYPKKMPFKVELDYSAYQNSGGKFFVKILSDNEFQLTTEDDKVFLYNFTTGESIDSGDKLEYDQKHSFAQEISHDKFKFTIKKDPKYVYRPKDSEIEYFFEINTIEGLAKGYMGAVEVTHVDEKGSILELTIQGQVAQKQVDYLDALVKAYMQSKLDQKNEFALGTIRFIDEQLSSVSDSLGNAERALANVRAQVGALDVSTRASDALQQQRKFEEEYSREQYNFNYYNSLLQMLQDTNSINAIQAPQSVGIQNPLLNNLIMDLQRYYQDRSAMGLRGGATQSLELSVVNKKIDNTRQAILGNIKSIVSQTDMRMKQLEGQLGRVRADLVRLPYNATASTQIQRKVTLTDNLYNYLMQRRYEAGIAQSASTPDSRAIDAARLTKSSPIAPNKPVLFMTFLMIGLLLPTLVVLGADLFDNKIHNEEQIGRLTDIPLIGTILHDSDKTSIFDPDFILSPLAESYRYLKVNLDYLTSPDTVPVIGVTSMVKGEGKTFTSGNLAAILALSGKNTVIIEADIRQPMLSNRFGIENEVGLCNYLIGRADLNDIIHKSKISNLSVISSGVPPPNPSESLSSFRFELMIKELKKRFDIVIVDTAPVGLVSDYLILNKFMEKTIFVMRQNYSQVNFVRDAQKLKDDKRVNSPYFV